ncbi:toxin TcdB middle/N-terminal domain-containing protein [uncultured Lamprocystis sp.]|jgi:RHS repeat-associated protein|uniref:toxin TcdB middle/N-terminal domain-containing protein n=1 Tax=uncultured Lamprocystis sp. TaxID=543132 RepID=UPI0025F3052C|nr:toxin TcdB middle/N-terminal domain-containing protein [uncultured Lamprocystis sp.]
MNRAITLCLALASLLLPGVLWCEDKSGVEPQVLSLPKGPGSIEGLGESFEPQLNTGTAAYQVKLAVPPGVNKHQPALALLYNSGYGNSALGIGWRLNVPSIQRQTDKGLPTYTDADTFIHSDGGELVPLGAGLFRPKIEGSFHRLQRVGDGWQVWERDGTRLDFGTSAAARMDTPLGSFEWRLERSTDTNGNEIRYLYETHGGQPYLSEIRYSLAAATLYKSVHFRYEDRPDAFTDCHSRSRVLTARRLAAVEMRSQGVLVRKYRLDYQAGAPFSLLASVVQLGADGLSSLPAMAFGYSGFDPTSFIVGTLTNPPPYGVSLTNPNVDLIDIDGDGLPDLVHTDRLSGSHRFYLNRGRGALGADPVSPAGSPQYYLDTKGVMMSDMDGDGLADLFIRGVSDFGYFRNRGRLAWEETDWKDYSPMPGFTFQDANVRLVDVNNDKLIDVLRDNGSAYQVWLNPGEGPWNPEFDAETTLPLGAHLGFTSPTTKLGDMNGDRMEDLVFVRTDGVSYFPSKGNGEFDGEVEMGNPPTGLLPADATLTDINNDGLVDLVVVGNEHVRVWLNGANGAYKPENLLEDTPSTAGNSAFRFADLDGDGFRDLLITNQDARDPYQTVSFNAGVHPNLLTRIRNGLGQETRIEYRSSIEDYLRDRDAGNPWTRKLPFPVHVVSRVTVRDNNSGQEYVTDYRYRDGYYDGAEKEFRGFAQVEKLEHGGPGAPSLLTRHSFDVGDTQESRKGMPLAQAVMVEGGTQTPPVGLFEAADHRLTTRTLATGTNGVPVTYSFTHQTDTRIYEGTAQPVALRRAWDQDGYGNVIADLDYGIVVGTDLGAGQDEVLTRTDYRIDTARWIVNLPSRVSKTDRIGGFVSLQRLTYDTNGNLKVDERSPDGTRFIAVTRNDYDGYGNIVKVTDANGHWRRLDYDPTFHAFPITETIGDLGLSMTATYDLGLGLMTAFTDPNGHTTGFGYDTFGRLTRIIKPGDTAALPTQTFEYRLGDPVSAIATKSREVSGQPGTYDSLTWFDGLGRKLQTRSEGENGDWVVKDAAVFNQRRGLARQWLPHFAPSSDYADPDPALAHTDIQYDARGRSIRETNPDATFRTTRYLPLTEIKSDEEDNLPGGPHADTPHTSISDGRKRLVEVRERNGVETYVTRYGYDGLDNLTRILDHQGNLKTLRFDGLGRKTRMEDPDKGLMTYGYDDAGNLLQATDAKGQTVIYTYEPANRTLTEAVAGDGVKVRYHYDADLPPGGPALENTLGRLAWVEDQAGRQSYSYDTRGKVARQVRRLDGLDFITGTDWDAMDRLTRLTYPDGSQISYQYNAMGQLESVPGYVEAIDYAPTGQKSTLRYANALASRYDYDGRQRLDRLRTEGPGSQFLQDLRYSYDGASNIVRIADQRPVKTPEDRTGDYGYDDLYRLTSATAPAWTETYAYDSIGNMTFKSDLGVMTYGAGSAGPHALTRAAGIDYGYDANGNLAAKQGFGYRFDYRDRLARVDRAGNGVGDGAVIDYAYDSGFDRKRKTVTLGGESQTTLYVDRYTELRGDRLIKQVFAGDRLVARVTTAPFDPAMLAGWAPPPDLDDLDVNPRDGVISLAEIRGLGSDPGVVEPADAAAALRVYAQGRETNPNRLPFATMAQAVHAVGQLPRPATQETVFYVPDHLGSASVVADTAGGVLEESVFYPYGKDRVRTGEYESEYRFTGKELDGETGLHYFGARYLDALTGRFVSVDPLYAGLRKEDASNAEGSNGKDIAEHSREDYPINSAPPHLAQGKANSLIPTLSVAGNRVALGPRFLGPGDYASYDPRLLYSYAYSSCNPVVNIDRTGLSSEAAQEDHAARDKLIETGAHIVVAIFDPIVATILFTAKGVGDMANAIADTAVDLKPVLKDLNNVKKGMPPQTLGGKDRRLG